MLKRRYNNTLLLERLNDNLSETDCDVNSAHAHLDRAGGHLISKDITISASNTSANINCFLLTGSVEIYRIYGVIKTKIKEVLEVNDCQNIYEVFKHT